MSHARTEHPNARLTPLHRMTMVNCVVQRGWTIEQTAERFQVDAKTVRKWRDRFMSEGEAGLRDRSSRPHHSPNRTPRAQRRRVVRLRKNAGWEPITSPSSSTWRLRPCRRSSGQGVEPPGPG